METNELLPCPWGGTVGLQSFGGRQFRVVGKCANCPNKIESTYEIEGDAQCPFEALTTRWFWTKAEAISAWNSYAKTKQEN